MGTPVNSSADDFGMTFGEGEQGFFSSNRTDGKGYDLQAIKALLCEKGIALSDTGHKVRRLAGNASDKFLEIVEPVDLKLCLPACLVAVRWQPRERRPQVLWPALWRLPFRVWVSA